MPAPPGAGAPYKTPHGTRSLHQLPATTASAAWVSSDGLRLLPTELLLSPMPCARSSARVPGLSPASLPPMEVVGLKGLFQLQKEEHEGLWDAGLVGSVTT